MRQHPLSTYKIPLFDCVFSKCFTKCWFQNILYPCPHFTSSPQSHQSSITSTPLKSKNSVSKFGFFFYSLSTIYTRIRDSFLPTTFSILSAISLVPLDHLLCYISFLTLKGWSFHSALLFFLFLILRLVCLVSNNSI